MDNNVSALAESGAASERPPLAVDLDGTLILSDTFRQGLISLLSQSPFTILALVGLLPKGRAAVKHAVAARVQLDPALLPYNQELLAYLRAEKTGGRRIGLFTAADQSIADAVAAHLGCFELARGSDRSRNLRGQAKAEAIEAAFGPVFTYAGDSRVDIPIFLRANSVVLAGANVRALLRVKASHQVEAIFPVPSR